MGVPQQLKENTIIIIAKIHKYLTVSLSGKVATKINKMTVEHPLKQL
tara:strand:- start:360 stop:500 length:141 start_codon:yes stop_codon:yes gene_type:complete